MRGFKQVVLVATLLLVMSVSFGALAQADQPLTTGLRPDAPAYGARGLYPVGAREVVIEGETPLTLTLWYPALNPDNAEAVITYLYAMKFAEFASFGASVTGQAISDAPFDLSGGAYPLVILSAGFASGGASYAWLAEHLASHGFVVIAPEHDEVLENFDPATSQFWRSAFTRPQEIMTVFAYVDEQVSAGGSLEGLVDAETVAVIGHSYGGYTALAAAGAQLDLTAFVTRCEATPEASPEGWLCGLFIPFMADIVEFVGLTAVPEGLWTLPVDERVDAIVPMAGDAYLFDQAGLAKITVPVLAMNGTHDTGTPYEWGASMTYDHVSSTTKALVAFENAEHMIFAASCEAFPFFEQIGFYQACSDPVWDMNRAHDLANHFTTAFLLAQLKQDAAAAAALAPDAVQFLGITYQAQGF